MGCLTHSKKTVNAIVDSGNHYVLQVKANQQALFKYLQAYSCENAFEDIYQVTEQTHGRLTQWIIKVYKLENQSIQQQWKQLKSFILIQKQVTQKGKKHTQQAQKEHLTQSLSYRISDLWLSAKEFSEGIRKHWGIENRLHWVKDVNYQEDNNRIKHQNIAVNMAIFNAISLNYLRQNVNDSIKYAQIIFGQNFKELCSNIRT
ncbi:ISAs1 family transposase [Arcicella aquatica]|uniref:ISAs1 family transposase n=1 Tax=Arcicella aquatica TaxID=217141 RepID=A0ABU5QWG7_9BACT|nr:ISAs1 family transposase [Arcicella aquatica]MEA5261070.1 ISAs1 family transposase [Arcicella aquatica]